MFRGAYSFILMSVQETVLLPYFCITVLLYYYTDSLYYCITVNFDCITTQSKGPDLCDCCRASNRRENFLKRKTFQHPKYTSDSTKLHCTIINGSGPAKCSSGQNSNLIQGSENQLFVTFCGVNWLLKTGFSSQLIIGTVKEDRATNRNEMKSI